ncbi:hypothetical protein DH2020_017374 [Rehmannia glutinosa]|uniref:Uncharacterized protein n=1 Tax=Rehmannia glutinosa TaxID=99300 RepID=A0ABR0WU78_REHGL
MANLNKLDFTPLDISGRNYLSWVLNVELHLAGNGLGDAKTVILPRAIYEWMQLRLQDFKTVSDYNSSMFRIVSKLRLCGEIVTNEDMLEKTYSTFHASNVIPQQQYRQKGFTTYSQLISCLLVAEENNDLLMQNHQARPTGSAPLQHSLK